MTDRLAVTEAEEVTPEILEAAEEIHSGWYAREARVDWEDFLDRLDGIPLADGTRLDLGGDTTSPAIKRIKTHIRELRKQ